MTGPSLGEAVVDVGADTSGFQRELDAGIKRSASTAERSFQSLGKNLTSAGRSLSLAVTAPILGIGVAAVKAQAQFEQSMNVLQVNAGASAKQMDKLDGLAKKLGADTVFSAGEAADAMLELAKGGFKPAQIAGGGVQATMALAATESINLADAATITSNAMNIFGLKAKDASQIADSLAAASSASTASVTSLAEGMGNVGAAATQAGLDLQDTVAVLAALDQEGLKGAEGGTALRSFLMRLVPNTKKARLEMDHLGVSFVNANGSMKSIEEIAGVLQSRLGGLSAAQRKQALQTIFGTYASSAATILMKQGTKGIGEFIKATEKQGVAQKLANARMDGTAGAIERLRGSLETAALAAGEALAPSITKAAKFIGNLADKFTALDPQVQTAVVTVAALAAAAGPLLIVTGSLIRAFGTIKGTLGSVASGMNTARASTVLFASEVSNVETRSTALKGALSGIGSIARSAAGPAGLGLLAASAVTTSGKLQALETIGGGALTGFAAGGPIGAAIGGGAGLLLTLKRAFQGSSAAATKAAEANYDYKASLDKTSGAITKMTGEQIRQNLVLDGGAKAAARLGIPMKDVIGFIEGKDGAIARVNKELERLANIKPSAKDPLASVTRLREIDQLTEVLGINSAALMFNRNQVEQTAGVTRKASGEMRKALHDAANTDADTRRWSDSLIGKVTHTKGESKRLAIDLANVLVNPVQQASVDLGRYRGSIRSGLNGAKGDAASGGREVGAALKAGMMSGIAGAASQLAASAASAVHAAVAAAKAAGKINSPSRVMADVGMDLGRGLALGMDKSQSGVALSASRMMGSALVAPVGISNTSAVRPVPSPRSGAYAGPAAPGGGSSVTTVTHEGVTVNQNYYGPNTSSDRLREIDWTLRYATGRPNEGAA